MPCTSPINGWKPIDGGPLTFGKEPANAREITIRCGRCADCRLGRNGSWAMRCMHEAQLHEQNCFVTLTYNEEQLPEHGSLYKPHLQKFFKRLRKQLTPHRISYYACGEYGDQTDRAHYHACIFGWEPNDQVEFKRTPIGVLYLSETLTQLWGHGNTSVAALCYETAAYTASYIMKKTLGKGCPRYVRHDTETGELIPLVQPFGLMSLKPAIGRRWIEKNYSDIYSKDYLVIRGGKKRAPAYYDKIYDTIDNDHMEEIKKQRITNAEPMTENELRARAKITHARIKAKQKTQV